MHAAFVLQLLRDKDELNTRHGRAAFGMLLFQDLAIVPILVFIRDQQKTCNKRIF